MANKISIITFIAVLAVLFSATSAFAAPEASELEFSINALWVLIAAAMVFLMQAGFLCFEVGAVRDRSVESVAMKNLVDAIMSTLGYFLVGFGFMFGQSSNNWIGASMFFLNDLGAAGANELGMYFFLFQLAFAATAATIISGAVAERTAFLSYVVTSFVVGLFIYPIFGYWVWGNLYFASNTPWLASLGFMDFAGSTVVHSVGGWVALMAIWMLGPRIGRYDATGNIRPMKAHNLGLISLGTFILWFGWWGFNGGSQLALDSMVPLIITNTIIAACAAGFSAFIHALATKDEFINEKFVGGTLGGLVAITACCNVMTPMGSLIIGLIVGIFHNYCWDLVMRKLKLDDPVGAVPVHLCCGIFGTLAVAFGNPDMLAHPMWHQLGVQLIGVLAAMVWTCTTAFILFKILRATIGMRVSPKVEKEGIKMAEEHFGA